MSEIPHADDHGKREEVNPASLGEVPNIGSVGREMPKLASPAPTRNIILRPPQNESGGGLGARDAIAAAAGNSALEGQTDKASEASSLEARRHIARIITSGPAEGDAALIGETYRRGMIRPDSPVFDIITSGSIDSGDNPTSPEELDRLKQFAESSPNEGFERPDQGR
jgi:hypothetical protein